MEILFLFMYLLLLFFFEVVLLQKKKVLLLRINDRPSFLLLFQISSVAISSFFLLLFTQFF